MSLRIYFTGAASTGKTTLASEAARVTRLPLVTNVARDVAMRMGKSLDEIRGDLRLCDHYQRAVFSAQVDAEAAHKDTGLVSDRCFDNLVYLAEYGTSLGEMMIDRRVRDYLASLHDPGVVVFFCRPDRGLTSRDGFRSENDLAWDRCMRHDGMTAFVLQSYGIGHYQVTGNHLRDRVELVRGVIRLAAPHDTRERPEPGRHLPAGGHEARHETLRIARESEEDVPRAGNDSRQ